MKEYKVQMFANGEGGWVFARLPFGESFKKVFSDKGKAKDALNTCKQKWDKYKKDFPRHAKDSHNPTDFRILSREVTEWVCEQD